jgi:hypothetical protein
MTRQKGSGRTRRSRRLCSMGGPAVGSIPHGSCLSHLSLRVVADAPAGAARPIKASAGDHLLAKPVRAGQRRASRGYGQGHGAEALTAGVRWRPFGTGAHGTVVARLTARLQPQRSTQYGARGARPTSGPPGIARTLTPLMLRQEGSGPGRSRSGRRGGGRPSTPHPRGGRPG